jgi:WD40 repeat protein
MELLEIDAFDIIAHFLSQGDESVLTLDLFMQLGILPSLLSQSNGILRFLKSITLNFGIWNKAPSETLLAVLETWKRLFSQSNDFSDVLTPAYLLAVCDSLFEKSAMTVPIRSILLQLLIESIKRRVNDDIFAIFILILTKHADATEHIPAFLEVLHVSVEFSPELQPKFVVAILQTPALALHQEPAVQLSLLSLIDRGDSAFAVDYLHFYVKHACGRSVEENTDSLISFSGAFVGHPHITNMTGLLERSTDWKLSPPLLPFCLIFACFGDGSLFGRILAILLSEPGYHNVIVKYLTPFTFLLVVAFSVGRSDPGLLPPFIVHEQSLCADAFRLLDMFAVVSHVDFHEFQNDIAFRLLTLVSHSSFPGDRRGFVELIVDFICFRPEVEFTKTVSDFKSLSLLHVIVPNPAVVPAYVFALKVSDGQWLDMNILNLLADIVCTFPEALSDRFLVAYSFAAHPRYCQETHVGYLDGLASAFPADSPAWAPLILQAAKKPEAFALTGQFKKRFGSKWKMGESPFRASNDEIEKFIANYRPGSKIDSFLTALSTREPPYAELGCINPKGQLLAAHRRIADLQELFRRSSLRLLLSIRFDGSPFGGLFPSIPWTKRFDRSFKLLFSLPKYLRRPSSLPLTLPVFSIHAERIKPARTITGEFLVSSDSCRFLHSSHSLTIPGDVVTHIFFSKDQSLQIFADDFRCYLFRFPSGRDHVIAALRSIRLPKLVYFQSGPAEAEESSLRLSHQWRTRQLSTVEYLLWLNFLAGNSFLSPTERPIFPSLSSDPPSSVPAESCFNPAYLAKLATSASVSVICRWTALPFAPSDPPGPRVPLPGEITETIAFRYTDSPIISIGGFGKSVESARLIAVTEDGRVLECRSNSSVYEIPVARIPTAVVAFQSAAVIFRSKSAFSVGVLDLDKQTIKESGLTPHLCAITALAAAPDLILSGGADGSVAFWHSLEKCEIVFAHSAEVTTLIISSQYGVALSASTDGAVSIAALPEIVVIRRIEIGFTPKAIALTRNSGLIIAGGERRIRTFTLNGEPCGDGELSDDIQALCATSTRRGSDYVAVALANGQLELLDPEKMERQTILIRMPGLRHVGWSEMLNILTIAGDGPSMLLVPFLYPDDVNL